MPQWVEGEHVRPARSEGHGQVLLHQRRDEQPRHEQHPSLAITELGVGQAMAPCRERRAHDQRLADGGHRANYAPKTGSVPWYMWPRVWNHANACENCRSAAAFGNLHLLRL